MFFKTVLASTLASIAVAAPAGAPVPQPAYFSLIAVSSGSAVHLRSVNATNGVFSIGKDTTTTCPDIANVTCPANKGTELVSTVPGNGFLNMNVYVPGGQHVYLAPIEHSSYKSYSLAYTVPHSGGMPVGSLSTEFEYTPPASGNSQTLGKIAYKGKNFYACPAANLGPPYSVVAAETNPSPHGECIEFVIATSLRSGTEAPAYEYTN